MSDHHKFHYIELPAPDIAAMKAFYGGTFDWTFKDWGPEYVEIKGGGIEGGFDGSKGERKPSNQGTLVILFSDDLEASQKAVIENGGTISMETIEFPGGRRFHFTDPCGNELGIWTKV